MNIMLAFLPTPAEVAVALAERARRLRLGRGWSQAELAERAGVAFSTLRLFESTGQISLERLIRLALVLGAVDGFDGLMALPTARSLADLEGAQPQRKRGRRRRR